MIFLCVHVAISIAVVEVVLRGKGDGRVVAEVIGAVHGMHGILGLGLGIFCDENI